MAKEFQRAERVADFLQQELAVLIAREVRDPRVGLVDVTGVEVSRDLSRAKVFVTFPADSAATDEKERVAVLNGAAGYLRSLLAKSSTMRFTPGLLFIYDVSVERGSYLTRLIDEVVEEDRKAADDSADPKNS